MEACSGRKNLQCQPSRDTAKTKALFRECFGLQQIHSSVNFAYKHKGVEMDQSLLARTLEEAGNPDERDPNLWAKCFVDAEGDEKKARALYVKARIPVPVPPAPTHGWCPNCSNECRLDASTCQKCGASFGAGGWQPTPYKPTPKPSVEPTETDAKAKSGGGVWRWVLGLPVAGFVLLMLIGSCAGNSPEGKERASSRDAIKYCWDEQSKKSLSGSTARLVAGACEKMESDFKARWGRNP